MSDIQIFNKLFLTNLPCNGLNLTYDSKNNISKVILSSSNDNITFNLIETSNYTYDDKENPLKTTFNTLGFDDFHISPSFQFSMFKTLNFNYLAAYSYNWISNNNLTSAEHIYPSGGSSIENYSYTYDQNDKPIKVVISNEDGETTKNFFYSSF